MFAIYLTVWSMDPDSDSTSGNVNRGGGGGGGGDSTSISHYRRGTHENESPEHFIGLSSMGLGIEHELRSKGIPKAERPDQRWAKLQEYTKLHAGALNEKVKEERKLSKQLNSPIHKLIHKKIDTLDHKFLKEDHMFTKMHVQSLNKGLHGAVKDVETYRWHDHGNHKFLPDHASKDTLRDIIRSKHPSYVSPASTPPTSPNSSPSRSVSPGAASSSKRSKH